MLIGFGHEAHLLRIKTQLLTLVINELNTLEELVIEDDAVAQLAQHRTHLLCNRVHIVITVCLQHIEEHTYYAIQQQTRSV